MTPIKDTFEQWNLVDSMPLELEKMIVRRNTPILPTATDCKKSQTAQSTACLMA